MSSITLPPELLIKIFKHIGKNYKTLCSCILVNKHWCNINIPILWRSPFYSVNSTIILINCLLEEDKCLLVKVKGLLVKDENLLIGEDNVPFKLLEKPPLFNYARFAIELDIDRIKQNLQKISVDSNHRLEKRLEDYHLRERLKKFILDHSTTIRRFKTVYLESCRFLDHQRFEACFQNLYKLECCAHASYELFDKLATICRNIQVLKISCNKGAIDDISGWNSIAELIKAQKQIKRLVIDSEFELDLSDEFKKANLIHSKSIIDYSSYGGRNNLDSLILPTLKNLKKLKIFKAFGGSDIKYLRSVSLPNLEVFCIDVAYQKFISDLSEFIKINGSGLKILKVIGCGQIDDEFLGELLKSIGQHCLNLEHLLIIYSNDEFNQKLVDIFNNCNKLKSIRFSSIIDGEVMDVGNIISLLNQALPINLNTVIFDSEVTIYDRGSLDGVDEELERS